jgi:hypothetical protein
MASTYYEELRRQRTQRRRDAETKRLKAEAARRVPQRDPEPGFWRLRLAKGGPLVAACICVVETTTEPGNAGNDMAGTRSPHLAAFVLDEPVAMDRVWHWRLEPITENEYRFQCATAAWAKKFSPEEPIANPKSPVDLKKLPIPFTEDEP